MASSNETDLSGSVAPVLLPELLAVAGDDAPRFLQAQLTCDLREARQGDVLPFAWLTPAGRVQASGWVLVDSGRYYLLVAGGRGSDLAGALGRYVLRDKVRIESASAAFDTARGQEPVPGFLVPGAPRRLVLLGAGSDHGTTANDWLLAGIRAGVCELPAAGAGKFLPQMLNLDCIGGVSFSKGCYPGQEVVARTHNLGKVKRRLARFAGHCRPPQPGAPLTAGDKKAGEVVIAAQAGAACELLAVVSAGLSRAETLQLADQGTALEPLALPYAVPQMTPDA